MRSRRSTIVTLIAVGSGLVVLLVAGIALQGPIRERWYISRLTSSDARTREKVANRLAEMGAVKAIPHLMRAFVRTVGFLEDQAGTGPFAQMENIYGQSASRATVVSNLEIQSRLTDGRVITRPSRSAANARGQLRLLQRQSAVFDSRVETLAQDVLTDASARALMKIAKGSSAEALPRLILELQNEKWEVRWLAVRALETLDSEEATAAIRSMVNDENDHVRHAANAAKARRDQSGEDRGPGTLRLPIKRTSRRGF